MDLAGQLAGELAGQVFQVGSSEFKHRNERQSGREAKFVGLADLIVLEERAMAGTVES